MREHLINERAFKDKQYGRDKQKQPQNQKIALMSPFSFFYLSP